MIVVGERGWCPRPFLVWSFQAPTKEGKERKERKKKIDDAENAESTEVSSSIVEILFFLFWKIIHHVSTTLRIMME